jgi:hypothetical protein
MTHDFRNPDRNRRMFRAPRTAPVPTENASPVTEYAYDTALAPPPSATRPVSVRAVTRPKREAWWRRLLRWITWAD